MSEVSKPYQSEYDYIITSVLFENDYGDNVDIRNNLVELAIYENIERPYLTADLMMKDDFGFYDRFNINGTERCTITIRQPSADAYTVTRTFIIRNVMSTRKINDFSEILSLKLIEDIAFNNNLQKFSKSFRGSPTNIIKNITRNFLDIDVDGPAIQPAQSENMKVVIPFMTPFEACDWVRKRASTENGMPYFFYRNLVDDNIQLRSLEEMILARPWNRDIPYRFSEGFSQQSSSPNNLEKSFNIESFASINKENMLDLVTQGAVGSDYEIFDATTGRREIFHFDVRDAFNQLKERNVFSNRDIPVALTDYRYNSSRISDYGSKRISRVVMNNTYPGGFVNYTEEDNIAKFKLDAINRSFQYMLRKSSISIRIPGVHFLKGENKSVGRQIEVAYLNNRAQVLENDIISPDELIDRKRSGKYVIYSAKHSFVENEHKVDLSAVKLGNEI